MPRVFCFYGYRRNRMRNVSFYSRCYCFSLREIVLCHKDDRHSIFVTLELEVWLKLLHGDLWTYYSLSMFSVYADPKHLKHTEVLVWHGNGCMFMLSPSCHGTWCFAAGKLECHWLSSIGHWPDCWRSAWSRWLRRAMAYLAAFNVWPWIMFISGL